MADYVEYVDGVWRAKDLPEQPAVMPSHEKFEVGQKVRTDFGKGHVQQIVHGKPGWAKPRYYLVQLLNQPLPHLFAEHEMRKFYFKVGES